MKKRSYVLSARELKIINKFRLEHKDNASCEYCKKELTLKQIRVDHKFPVSRDGETVPENLAISCESCNSEKGSKTFEEYMLYLEFKDAMSAFSMATLIDSLHYYQDILRETKNHDQRDEDGFFIRWKCQAISRILNERMDEQ